MLFLKRTRPTHTLTAFLESAADAYLLARTTGNVYKFSAYADSSVCDRLLAKARSSCTFYPGTKERSRRSFTILEDTGSTVTVQFDLTHEDFDYGEVQVGLGDELHQIWVVQRNPYKIAEIKRRSHI